MVGSLLDRARAVAATVTDPELPMLTLADLGVLREVEVDGDAVVVAITPTAPAPVAGTTPTRASTGWVSKSSACIGQTSTNPASRRRRDSAVPCANVRNQRPAKSRW